MNYLHTAGIWKVNSLSPQTKTKTKQDQRHGFIFFVSLLFRLSDDWDTLSYETLSNSLINIKVNLLLQNLLPTLHTFHPSSQQLRLFLSGQLQCFWHRMCPIPSPHQSERSPVGNLGLNNLTPSSTLLAMISFALTKTLCTSSDQSQGSEGLSRCLNGAVAGDEA